MKKITFILTCLISLIGFAQAELITNGDFETGTASPWIGNAANPVDDGSGSNFVNQANVTNATPGTPFFTNLSQVINLTSGSTYTLSFDAYTDAVTGTRSMIAGLGQNGGSFLNVQASPAPVLTATLQTFTYEITINYGESQPDRVLFDMAGETGFVFIDNVSVVEVVPDLTNDVSLSSLQLDNATIAGFDSEKTSYSITLPDASIIPQITLVTPTNPNATVSAINQATAIPGSASFDVTSENSAVTQTYTINFSDQSALTQLIGNGSFETGDFTDWQSFPSAPGNQVVVNTNPSEGTFTANINNTVRPSNSLIKSANRGIGIVNGGDEVTIKFDVRGSTGAGGVIFVELFSELSGGGVSAAQILSGGPLALNSDPEVWTSYEFTTNLGPDVSGGVTLQFGAVTGGDASSFANLFLDNVSMVNNNEILSIDENEINLNFKVYPNPAANEWNIESLSTIDTIEVYDILGKRVKALSPNNRQAKIEASDLKTGIYLAKLYSDGTFKTIRLVKK